MLSMFPQQFFECGDVKVRVTFLFEKFMVFLLVQIDLIYLISVN
jgi:hypothetical protein